ncbi:MAG: rod shape-determining protein MreD [Olegusella sp.]|nr:rod shape-determining protein MreD [Olegusella sp.]
MQVRDTNKDRRSIGVLALVCAVVQLAIAPNIVLGAGRANIALVFAGIVALSIGGRTGVFAGFCAGLFYDMTTTGPVGLMALLLTVCSYVLGTEERNRLADDPTASLAVFAVGDLAVCLAYHVTLLLVGQTTSVVDALVARTLPSFVLTFVAFLIFTYFLTRGSGGSSGVPHGRRNGSHYTLGKL